MILTKENVAAQAFAEHIESFGLPEFVTSKIGRLVGYMELKKNKTNKKSFDVTCENRHEVLKQKRLLIGCGGGFQQECSQSYSPVATWIKEVALTLTDESQQYGNIEETSVIARTPRTCLNVCFFAPMPLVRSLGTVRMQSTVTAPLWVVKAKRRYETYQLRMTVETIQK